MSDPAKNIALLIDADNASPDRFEDVLAILAELGTVNIRRAYGNWEKASLKGWKASPEPMLRSSATPPIIKAAARAERPLSKMKTCEFS